MTQQQIESNAQYLKALARAHAENLSIRAYGTIKATNEFFYGVSSSQDSASLYAVIVRGHALVCNCKAGEKGQYCKHRALVTEHLMHQVKAQTTVDAIISRDNPLPAPRKAMAVPSWRPTRAAPGYVDIGGRIAEEM